MGWVDGWMDSGWEWGQLGGRGKGKQMGSSFRATVPGPSGPREPQKDSKYLPSGTVFLGAPPGFSAWPATYGTLAYIYLSIY